MHLPTIMQDAEDELPMESRVGELLDRLGATLAVAESATGGRVLDRVSNIPGCSNYLVGGLVVYDNRAKVSLLGVKNETLKDCGAVSRETASEMAQGVRRRFEVDLGLSTTGIAGPNGATEIKPVGLVYVSVASTNGVRVQKFVFHGNRISNKEAFASAALGLLHEELELLVR